MSYVFKIFCVKAIYQRMIQSLGTKSVSYNKSLSADKIKIYLHILKPKFKKLT